MRARLWLPFLIASTLFGAEAQLPSGAALPPGMTAGEAKAIAQQNGITIGQGGQVQLPPGMTQDQARALAQQNGVTVPSDRVATPPSDNPGLPKTSTGTVDDAEGDVEPSKDPAQDDPDAADEGDPTRERKLRAGDDQLRWGQKIFRFGDPSQAASHVGAIGPDYAMGPGDEIILTLWGQKEARYVLQIDRDGQVAIELVGVVSLNGQTLRSAEALLRKRLAKIYRGLEDGSTQMDVTLGKIKRVRVYVVGEAIRPGSFMLSGNTSVLAALFRAHGPSNLGSERQIEIRRGAETIKIDLYDYLARGRRPARDILQDGDLLRIPAKGPVVQVQGDVNRPGFYEMLESEGTKELVEYAGGFRPTVADQPIVAVRLFPGGRRDVVEVGRPSDLKSGKSASLVDQDQVMIYSGNDPTTSTFAVGGDVRFPGLYPWTAGMTVKRALGLAGGLSPSAIPDFVYLKRGRSDGSVSMERLALDSSDLLRLVLPLDTVDAINRFAFVEGGSVSITGAVRRPLTTPYRTGMTLRDLVIRANGFRKVGPSSGTMDTSASLLASSKDTAGVFLLDSILWFPAGHAFVRRRTATGVRRVERFTLAPIPDVPLADGDVVHIVDLLAQQESQSAIVSGLVADPGPQDVTLGLTVRDAILQAGGFLPGADPEYTRMETAKDSGGSTVRLLRLDTSLTAPDADLVLPPRSLLVVPRRLDRRPLDLVYVVGEVNRPGTYTLVRADEPVSSLIARAGGLRKEAFVEGGTLVRSDYGGHGRIVVDFTKAMRKPGSKADIGMRSGDTLTFPRRPTTIQVLGRVNDPGLVTWQEGASWKDYIAMAGGFQDSANREGVYVRQPNGTVQTYGNGIKDPLPGAQVVVPFKKPPEPTSLKDVFSGLNLILTTLVAAVTVYAVLIKD